MNNRQEKLLRALEGILGSWQEKIPASFYRTFAGKPFERCDYCRRLLLEPGTRYMINKYYQEGELQQETVQCYDCRQGLRGGDSKESIESVKRMFSSVPRSERLEVVSDPAVDRIAILTSRCLLCNVSKEEASVYFECAYCEGDGIVFFLHPMMICGNCLIRLYDALSEKTKDHRRRYYREHYGLPPDLQPSDLIGVFTSNIIM